MAFKLFPSFSFDESNVGPRPIRTASVDRIALVGMFERGPLSPQIVDAATAEEMFGFTKDVGSVHLQMMVAQGANSFLIKRVMPRGAKAYLDVAVGGAKVTTGGDLKVHLGYKAPGTSTVVVNTVTVTLTVDSVPAQVKDGIANTINITTDAAGKPLPIRAMVTPEGKLRFENKAEGDILATVKIELNGTAGITYDPDDDAGDITTTAITLKGGKDAPAHSQSVLKNAALDSILHLETIWPGESGNRVAGLVTEGSIPGCFDFEFSVTDSDGDVIYERYKDVRIAKYDSMEIDLYDEDKMAAFKNSKVVRVQHVKTDLVLSRGNERGFVDDLLDLDAVTKQKSVVLTFTGGDNGDGSVTTLDFNAGIDALRDIQCTIVTCPGEKPSLVDQRAINNKIVQHVAEMENIHGEALGLRIGVISPPRMTNLSGLRDEFASGAVGDNKRIVYVTGWGTTSLVPKFKKYGVDPAAVYAAHLAVVGERGAHISPAARTSAPSIVGLLEVDTPVGVVAHNEITRLRMEAIILDPVTRDFRMLNGRTTSSDGAWYWVCIRRVYDKIRMDVFFNMQFIKSEPSSKEMDSVIENSINGYLANLMSGRVINGYNPAVSNDTNNPPAVRAMGIRYVDFGIEPVFPNDFVQFNINRVLTASVRLA